MSATRVKVAVASGLTLSGGYMRPIRIELGDNAAFAIVMLALCAMGAAIAIFGK
jgi:hypothetical protein